MGGAAATIGGSVLMVLLVADCGSDGGGGSKTPKSNGGSQRLAKLDVPPCLCGGQGLWTSQPWHPPTPMEGAESDPGYGETAEIRDVIGVGQNGRGYVVAYAHGMRGKDALHGAQKCSGSRCTPPTHPAPRCGLSTRSMFRCRHVRAMCG